MCSFTGITTCASCLQDMFQFMCQVALNCFRTTDTPESENQKLCTKYYQGTQHVLACLTMKWKAFFHWSWDIQQPQRFWHVRSLHVKAEVAELRTNSLRPGIGEKSSSHTYIFWHPTYTPVIYREKEGPSKSPVSL